MKICAATGNAGKLRELRRILEAQGHEVVSQKELGITIEPEETGTTFAENARIKAEAARAIEAGHATSHIFNLGHGVLPNTKAEDITEAVAIIHEEN